MSSASPILGWYVEPETPLETEGGCPAEIGVLVSSVCTGALVLDDGIDMHYRDQSGEHVTRLRPGQVFVAEASDEHVAHPDSTASAPSSLSHHVGSGGGRTLRRL